MADAVGAGRAPPLGRFEACGSPGEVANDPALGNNFLSFLEPGPSATYQLLDETNSGSCGQKDSPWTNVVMTADDQLRQRMAWALSQTFVVGDSGTPQVCSTELHGTYYDIFVRHAFGNFRDVLREVSYSGTMLFYLTALNNKAYAYMAERGSSAYPDENYAREVTTLSCAACFIVCQRTTGSLHTDTTR